MPLRMSGAACFPSCGTGVVHLSARQAPKRTTRGGQARYSGLAIETAIGRYKSITGHRLRARSFTARQTEGRDSLRGPQSNAGICASEIGPSQDLNRMAGASETKVRPCFGQCTNADRDGTQEQCRWDRAGAKRESGTERRLHRASRNDRFGRKSAGVRCCTGIAAISPYRTQSKGPARALLILHGSWCGDQSRGGRARTAHPAWQLH